MNKFSTAVAIMIGVLIAFASQSSAAPTDNEIKPEAPSQPVVPQPHQTFKPVICQVTAVVVDNLKNKYNELPVFVGDGQDQAGTSYVVSLNRDNGEFTIVQFSADKNTACIIGSGTGAKITMIPSEKTKGMPVIFTISN
tara:strand:- start:365 stop:781 length:417 start_codon:yes stop_codon:yes gene_type:complete